MSSLSDGESQVKRDLVLDLLTIERAVADNDMRLAECMGSSAVVRACHLTDAGVNWREHKVRSKRYRGKLGILYDRTKLYHPKGMREV